MYIDELIEKAFCEGYEFAQKEFAVNSTFRHLKRDFKRNTTGAFKTGLEFAKGELSPEFVKQMAVNARYNRRFGSGARKEAAEKVSDFLSKKAAQDKGATRIGNTLW